MNILISILLIVVIIIVFALFLALVVGKNYFIQRDIIIDKPVEDVFEFIKHIRNQEKYSKWVMKDPHVNLSYSGTDGTEGFVSAWEGNKQAGKGEQEIKTIEADQFVLVEIRFEKPFKNVAQTYMYTTAVGVGQTKLKWTMEGRNSYPMNLFNLVIDNLLGKDLSESLVNIKRILERSVPE
ncbi:MAG: SRPBCC family protein [Bacteroidia bacterium]